MNVLFITGLLFWAIEVVALAWFLYECRDETTQKGYIIKGGAATNIVFYGFALVFLNHHVNGVVPSQATLLFLAGLIFAFLGDMGLGTMQRRHGGSSKAMFTKISSQEMTIETLTAGVVGSLFIIAFFLQTMAFIKGIHGDVQQFAIPFLIFFLLPPLFTLVGGLLAQYKLPELSTKMFIIAVFFILLTSALFASAAVFSFWFYRIHPNHAIYVFAGAILFFLSVLMLLIRYTWPEKSDTRGMRAVSRTLNFLSRMILAGCAFLF